MSSLINILRNEKGKTTEVVLPSNPEKAQKIIEGLDGTTDRILLALESGKYEIWQKMQKKPSLIINDKPTTRIGEYDVPGSYKFLEYSEY